MNVKKKTDSDVVVFKVVSLDHISSVHDFYLKYLFPNCSKLNKEFIIKRHSTRFLNTYIQNDSESSRHG